jgi:unconventional prefoldin RPB5 interactor 1
MHPQRDGLEHLEKLRTTLEGNIQKLRKSLAFWQLWEAEYEGLKETLQTLEDDSSVADMLAVGVDMGGDVVNENGAKDLLRTVERYMLIMPRNQKSYLAIERDRSK